jgi:hypothetical protein
MQKQIDILNAKLEAVKDYIKWTDTLN